MAAWLILLNIWGKDSRNNSASDAEAFGVLFALFLLPFSVPFLAWYLIWVAVRDNRGSRLEAVWWIGLAYALAAGLGALYGWFYGILAVFVAGCLALAYIVAKARRRHREEVSTGVGS